MKQGFKADLFRTQRL